MTYFGTINLLLHSTLMYSEFIQKYALNLFILFLVGWGQKIMRLVFKLLLGSRTHELVLFKPG